MRRNLLLLTCAVLLTLLLGELLVRVAIVVFDRPPIVVSNPYSGWANRPELTDVDVVVAGGRFRLSTDELGRRITYDASSTLTPSSAALLLVGDSFTFGLNVDDRDTFAWLLARSLPERRVINLGVPGWGTDQQLLSLALLDRSMDQSRLAWLVRSKAAGLRKPSSIESAAGVEVVLACLDAIRGLGEASGARTHVLAYRKSPASNTVSDAVWHGFVDRAGAVDLTPVIREPAGRSLLGSDGVHWNAAGHRRVAAVILERLRTTLQR